ncbi:MAG TPA: T9SS type A sorting domain-containing protein, partial [Chitinophagales bacterium]|nr:T9SS type A sorting domain-containing protein [Chitinophagales bacterium]
NDGDKNVLNWTTASEINTLKFEVERSPQSIGGVFTYIGELPAAGSSNVPLSYHLNDNNPLTGDNYYRLKMIDIDGTFKYSQTIFIRNDKDVVYTNAINGIYPNPTSHLINIDYQSAAISKVEIKILNVVGQEMSVTEMNTLKGNQLLQMDVSSFADGVYIINIRDVTNGTVQQSKFIKD